MVYIPCVLKVINGQGYLFPIYVHMSNLIKILYFAYVSLHLHIALAVLSCIP